MRMILTAATLLLLMTGNALAGSGYDSCIKEEKALKAQEAEDCHGLRYLLNPSACFATQKKLKEYAATGRCRNIGIGEKVDFNAPPVTPEKKTGSTTTSTPSTTSTTTTTSTAGGGESAVRTGAVSPLAVIQAEPAVPQQELTCEQLKDENARLRAEINRLTTELEQYNNACR